MFKKILFRFIFIFCISSFLPVYADKIRDLTSIQGIRDNQLVGYGLIVGLDGTGDKDIQSPYTTQSLHNMLSRFGISIPLNTTMSLKNIAAVVVTAELPPFSHLGEKINVVVSSIGNAHSLKGGTLLMTPLRGADNQIYAVAQGNVLVSEKSNFEKRTHINYNNTINSGIINFGAIIEREVHNNFGENNTINLQLNEENLALAQRISDIINIKYQDIAIPTNSKTIKLHIPSNNNVQVHILSDIQDIDVIMPIQDAKVIINSRTGVIVMNQEVKLGSCAISHHHISVIINNKESLDTLKILQNNTKKNESKKIALLYNLNRKKLKNIVEALHALGVQPEELSSMLQLMKSAGCLNAKLEIIS